MSASIISRVVAAAPWLALVACLSPAVAQEAPPPEPSQEEVEVVRATIKAAPGHREVSEVRLLKDGAGRVDWSQQGDWLAFDQVGAEGYSALYVMRVDGTAEKCLTCENLDFHRASALNPVWHPSGEYLVFQVQNLPRRLIPGPRQLAGPERGLHSELWVAVREGRPAWQLTRAGEQGRAVLDPHFSYEADQLVWSERIENRGEGWGQWGFQVAGFSVRRGLPRLGKVTTYEPGERKGWTVAYGFTPDDKGLLISASPRPGERESDLDLYRYDLATRALTPLVRTQGEVDGPAAFAPGKDVVVFASSRGLGGGRQLPWRQDLWLISLDGQRQERLTFWNDPGSSQFLGEALIADLAWSPQGDRLAVTVVSADPEPRQALWLVVLDTSYRR